MKVIPIRPGVRIMAEFERDDPSERIPFVVRWRDAVLSEGCSVQPTTKLVLLALTKYMDKEGRDCFPSTRSIAADTGLSRRCVETHIHKAEVVGWLGIEHRRPSGQGWRRYRYIPKGGERVSPYQGVPANDEISERGEPRSPDQGVAKNNVGKSVQDVGKSVQEGGEPRSPDHSSDHSKGPRGASFDVGAERKRSASLFADFSTTKQICKIEEDFKRRRQDRRYVKDTDDMMAKLERIMDGYSEQTIANHAERVLIDIQNQNDEVA